ncbi:alpha-amylase [Ferrimonas sediminicola]|uniref:Alpha-amylase n=1 Tax=Ferrimonas sediminicola TaxID=2569538 RepID=A0A4U1BCH0_9GAMM|nr:sugar phosphorylase [Ferrimonas sediminicola]TKB47735.1 alpha-amylase [Ferrimonas sediminicola]
MNQAVHHTTLEALGQQLEEHLQLIYPEADHGELAQALIQALGAEGHCVMAKPRLEPWDESDLIVISYGDSIRRQGEAPLHTLKRFFDHYLGQVATGVHILPFFPSSSDDGFAVIDYAQVNPGLGRWQDIQAIAADFRLMADLVINHCSSRSRWFEQFKAGQPPGRDYFISADPEGDYHQVVRPRTSELLKPVQTALGERHVWCTFSHDQVDLNFANPQVLVEMVKIIRLYLNHGVSIFRLDAVAFLWKEPGSNCLNLTQTHEIVRLLRTLVSFYDPRILLITETNIPNRENLAYFGNGNEAHAIYNFSLPPLLLHTLLTGDCNALKLWQMSMPPAQMGTTYLNFIASHDGIGLRPVEGLLDDKQIADIATTMEAFGGRISWRSLGEGGLRPYEINISLYDAMQGTLDGPDPYQQERFLCAHAIMLALEGLPAIYLHSLLATHNDNARVENTGNNRSINRHCWDADALEALLQDAASHHHQVFVRLTQLVQMRQRQPAFHPSATQFVLHLGEELFGLWRQSRNRDQSVFAVANVTREPQPLRLSSLNLIGTDAWRDLLSGEEYSDLHGEIELAPYQVVWLANRAGE